MGTSRKIWFQKKVWVGVFLAQFFLFFLGSRVESISRWAYVFFQWRSYPQQWLSALVPFSVGDLLYVLLVILLLFYLFKILLDYKGRRGKYITQLLVLFNAFYFLYQIIWGQLYFQPSVLVFLPKKERVATQDLKSITLKYLDKCKKSRAKVMENTDGIFTISDYDRLMKTVVSQQKKLPKWLPFMSTTEIIDIKPSLFSYIMGYTGISGYYNPFTAEVQYSLYQPSTYIPFTISHETAHQLGYAKENEANFIGYLLGVNSENIELKYSTEYFVLKNLLRNLSTHEPDFVKYILENYSEGMKRDRAYELNYQKNHQGRLMEIFTLANDWFLKSNQQEGSITYSYFVQLLLEYEGGLQ